MAVRFWAGKFCILHCNLDWKSALGRAMLWADPFDWFLFGPPTYAGGLCVRRFPLKRFHLPQVQSAKCRVPDQIEEEKSRYGSGLPVRLPIPDKIGTSAPLSRLGIGTSLRSAEE